jgi:hypothetical protein
MLSSRRNILWLDSRQTRDRDNYPTDFIKWSRTTKWINTTIIIPYGFLFPITWNALAIYAKEIGDDSLSTNTKLPVFPMILYILVVEVGQLILTHLLELYSKIVFCLSSSIGLITSNVRCKFALTVFYPQLYIFWVVSQESVRPSLNSGCVYGLFRKLLIQRTQSLGPGIVSTIKYRRWYKHVCRSSWWCFVSRTFKFVNARIWWMQTCINTVIRISVHLVYVARQRTEDMRYGNPSPMPPHSIALTHKTVINGAPTKDPSVLVNMTILKSWASEPPMAINDDLINDMVNTGRADPSA